MKVFLTFIFVLIFSDLFAQKGLITYHNSIKPLFDKHCNQCHFENGYGPFPLENFETVKSHAELINHVLENKRMPPWFADTNYRKFKNQNILSEREYTLVQNWIKNGCIEGVESKSSTKVEKQLNERVDTTWCVPMIRPYQIQEISKDLFKRFYVKTDFNRDVYVSRFEFKPGNKNIVHHSEVFIDTIGNDFPDLTFPGSEQIPGRNYEERNSSLNKFNYKTGWLPGEIIEEFPKGIYSFIPKGSKMYFLMHYAPTPVEQMDSSVLFIHESKNSQSRRIAKTVDLHGHSHIVNGRFFIPADSVVTIQCKKKIEEDISAFSILVHAHHLAQSVLAYAVTDKNDTIPLLKIPNWNFNWQFIYKFKNFQTIPKNATIHFFVQYDNTKNNIENPHNPPEDVHYSFDSDQEMMELFIYYVPYQKGDKNFSLEY